MPATPPPDSPSLPEDDRSWREDGGLAGVGGGGKEGSTGGGDGSGDGSGDGGGDGGSAGGVGGGEGASKTLTTEATVGDDESVTLSATSRSSSGCAVSRCITNACWVSFTVLMEAVTTMEPAAICGAIYRSMMTSAVRFRIQVRRRRATRVYAWQQWRALKVV